jgi:hypothetical protein
VFVLPGDGDSAIRPIRQRWHWLGALGAVGALFAFLTLAGFMTTAVQRAHLLENAAQYSPSASAVRVEARTDGGAQFTMAPPAPLTVPHGGEVAAT